MKTFLSQHASAIIIAVAILLATWIYAATNRYYLRGNIRLDRWTGKTIKIEGVYSVPTTRSSRTPRYPR